MSAGDQINFRPEYETDRLPCTARVGDVFVLSPLKEGEVDPLTDGSVSVWVCVKAHPDDRLPARWLRVHFDGYAECNVPVAPPVQDLPSLKRG